MDYILENYKLKTHEEIMKPITRRKSIIESTNIYILEKFGNYTKIQYEHGWYSIKEHNKIFIHNDKGKNIGYIHINKLKNKCKIYDNKNNLLFIYFCKKKLFDKNIKYINLNNQIIKGVNNIYFPTPDKLYKSIKNIKFVKNTNDNLEFVFQFTRNYFPEINSKSNEYTIMHSNFFDLYHSYTLALCCLYFY